MQLTTKDMETIVVLIASLVLVLDSSSFSNHLSTCYSKGTAVCISELINIYTSM